MLVRAQGLLTGRLPSPLLKDRLPKRTRRTPSLIGALQFRPLLLEGLLRTRGLQAKVDPSRIRRCQSLLPARAALLRVSPRGPPFCRRLHRCRRYQSEPDFSLQTTMAPNHLGFCNARGYYCYLSIKTGSVEYRLLSNTSVFPSINIAAVNI